MALPITVNGQNQMVTSSPDTPLLYVLRDELGLNGPRFGCGLSQCGACIVLVNGPSVDWRTYPILRFQDLPPIDIALIDHPDQPAWGAGEITTLTTPPAIANAVYHASGRRLRSVPLSPAQAAASPGNEA